MNNVALITGASGGIGKELAREHAKAGGDLVIVARTAEALDDLKRELESRHKVSVLCIPADISESGTAQSILAQLDESGIEVDILINNAGFGGHGKFHQRHWDVDKSMIELNCTALCEFTHVFLQPMVARKRGKILNVASTAGFIPGPLQAVYYATKAFVLSFSQAIAEELREDNITVTALCPGPVDTGFASEANLENVSAFKNAASPESVAKIGYDAMQQGKLVVINDRWLSFLLNWVAPLLPRRLVLKMSRQSMEKTGK